MKEGRKGGRKQGRTGGREGGREEGRSENINFAKKQLQPERFYLHQNLQLPTILDKTC